MQDPMDKKYRLRRTIKITRRRLQIVVGVATRWYLGVSNRGIDVGACHQSPQPWECQYKVHDMVRKGTEHATEVHKEKFSCPYHALPFVLGNLYTHEIIAPFIRSSSVVP